MIDGSDMPHVLGLERPIVLNAMQVDDLRRFRRWLRQKTVEGAKRSERNRPLSSNNPTPTEEIHETCPVVSQTNAADR